MESIVQFIQEQLDAIRPNAYCVSSERNLKSDLEKHDVVVSSLSGDVYSKSSNIPYQIDIITLDPDEVQADFFVLARNCNNVPFTKIIQSGETDFESITYNVVFNTPVAMEKSADVGTNHYIRLVAFASVNEMNGINQVKKIEIDGELIETLNSAYNYATEPNSQRVSGEELTKSKKKSASSTIVFTAISSASVFFNKAFKITAGQLAGNTRFIVNFELDNGLKAQLPMYISAYQLLSERAKLPAVSITLAIYDDRGDPKPPLSDLTNTKWTFNRVLGATSPSGRDMTTETQMVQPYSERYSVNFKFEGSQTAKTTLEFRKTRDGIKALRVRDSVNDPQNLNPITCYDYNTNEWNEDYGYDYLKTITIEDGDDVTNQNLINWLYRNATLVSSED